MEEVYCPRTPHEKAMQRALIQYRNPKNRRLVIEALKAAGREDLIGYDEKCLGRPDKGGARKANNQARGAKDQRGKRRGGSSAAGSCSKGTAADSDSRGKRQHGKSTGSLQRGKYGKRGEVLGSGGKVSPSRSSFKPQGRGPNKAAGSKGGIRRQGSKR